MRLFFTSIIAFLIIGISASGARALQANKPVLFPVCLSGKCGYINVRGQIVIAPRFERVTNFSEGLAAVMVESDWSYIDMSGKVVISTRSTKVRKFSEGLAAVLIDGRYGFIDGRGNTVIQPSYEAAFDFSEGLARVKIGGKWAFIDRFGKTSFVVTYEYADDFQNGFARVAHRFGESLNPGFANGDLKVAFVNKNGNLLSIGWRGAAGRFSEGLAVISNDENIIAGMTRGELVFNNLDVSEPSASFLKRVRFSFVDSGGETQSEGTYQHVNDFAEGLAAVRINNKWGYANKLGQLVIPARFDHAESFSEGQAFVRLGDEGHCIDRSGKTVFKTSASVLTGFKNGLARLFSCTNSRCQDIYIDKTGNIVWESTAPANIASREKQYNN